MVGMRKSKRRHQAANAAEMSFAYRQIAGLVTSYRPWERQEWSAAEFEPEAVDGRISVMLSPDYSAELPLWGQRWEALRLDPALQSALADWQLHFDEHFHHDRGWTGASARDTWAAEAEKLIRRLRRALPESVLLDVDLWPLSVR
jgi:hypothetical protein